MASPKTLATLPEDHSTILKEVSPERTLRTLYTLYLLIIVWAGILPWLVPLAFFSPPFLTLGIALPLLLAIVYALWWIGAYQRSIQYRFTSSALLWKRGVWFHQNGSLLYHRITSIDIVQGPLSRLLGICRLNLSVDGNTSGPGSATVIRINGITNPESLLELIRMQAGEKGSLIAGIDGTPSSGREIL